MSIIYSKYKAHFFHVFLPLGVGCLIYILCRPSTNMMFESFMLLARSGINVNFPYWITYNLPDGLWLYSFLMWLILTWKNEKSLQPYLWFFLLTIFALFSEFAQKTHIIQGTHDIRDVWAYLIAIVLCVYNHLKLSKI